MENDRNRTEKQFTGLWYNHPRWLRTRADVFERDNNTCQECGDTKSSLTGHHKVYINDGRPLYDYPAEFITTLCQNCHEKRHNIAKRTNEEDARDFIAGKEVRQVKEDLVSYAKRKTYSLKAFVSETLWKQYKEMTGGLTQDLVVREALKFALENDVFNQRIAKLTSKE